VRKQKLKSVEKTTKGIEKAWQSMENDREALKKH